jgi:predicted AlkP superfamily pyrophosphatase or phosphodiesterase
MITLVVRVFSRPVKARLRANVLSMSNGTDMFQPSVLIISLDGFRPDYIDEVVTPNLYRLRESGVAPEYMKPSFPSVTFPNHYTLVTGLYPESHGIVGKYVPFHN